MASFQVNQGVVQQQANAMAAPTIAAIHAIGAAATARYNATEQANDAQHAAYWARQDSNARNSQAFSNYLLDQTVVQNNDVNGTGTVGRATVWNSTADALVKADPNKYEYVDTPNYIKGLDY
jgi:cysteine synthase